MSRLSGRTISALRLAGIKQPHLEPIGKLLRIPNIGIKAITEIAERYYQGMSYLNDAEPWPEIEDRPRPVLRRCSHRVLITEHCPKCVADMRERGVIE